jgi:hypothetical protein
MAVQSRICVAHVGVAFAWSFLHWAAHMFTKPCCGSAYIVV